MDKIKRELKHSIGDTRRITNKEKESQFLANLQARFNGLRNKKDPSDFINALLGH